MEDKILNLINKMYLEMQRGFKEMRGDINSIKIDIIEMKTDINKIGLKIDGLDKKFDSSLKFLKANTAQLDRITNDTQEIKMGGKINGKHNFDTFGWFV